MASFIAALFLSTTPKNSSTSRVSSGWGCNSSWNAMAMLSKVTSSWVGPMPPEVMRCVYWGERRATSLAMTSCTSGMTVMRCTDTPSFLSARVRKALLVSTVWPWETKDEKRHSVCFKPHLNIIFKDLTMTPRSCLMKFNDSQWACFEGETWHWTKSKTSCLNHYHVKI